VLVGKEKDLEKDVNSRVEVRGTIDSSAYSSSAGSTGSTAAGSTAGSAGSTAGSAGSTAGGAESMSASASQTLHVNSVRKLSGSCSGL
jgi:hypothetical protein